MPTQGSLALKPEEPCLCGSTKLLKNCCLSAQGKLRKKFQMLNPPLPITGYAHSDCYLSATHDCSNDISKEHYMSRGILELIGGKSIDVQNVPWLPFGIKKNIGINSLGSKILCRRHNSALSGFDTEALAFFNSLRDVGKRIPSNSLISPNQSLKIISGEALELWMLKAVCGMYFSNEGAFDGIPLLECYSLDVKLMLDAFCGNRWAQGCGVYFPVSMRLKVLPENSLNIAPLIVQEIQRVVGAKIKFAGLEFIFIFDPQGLENLVAWLHRPTEFYFGTPGHSYSIMLTWECSDQRKFIVLEERDG